MPRPLWIEYEDACYHMMSLSDRRKAVFLDDADRQQFLGTLGEVCAQLGSWSTNATSRDAVGRDSGL